MTRGGDRASDSGRGSRWQALAWLIGPVAIVLALAYLIFQPSFDLFASTPSQTPTPAPISTATPFPIPDLGAVDTASIAIHAVPFEKDALVNGLAVAGTRLIAVGVRDKEPSAWYSDDGGETWTAASVETQNPPRTGAFTSMQAVAAFGSTLAALGQWQQPNGDLFTAAMWTSIDSGAHWTEVPRDAVPRNAYRLTGGGIGFLTTSGDARLQVSADGELWDDLPYDPSLNGVYATGFASRRGDVVLTADRLDESNGSILTPPVFWVYRSGSGWETVDRDGDEAGPASLRTLIADTAGFYAAGLVYGDVSDPQSSRAALWQSTDATHWHRILLSDEQGLQASQVAHGALGALVLGGAAGELPARAWLVPNGDAPAVQEYDIDWDILQVAGFGDRFIAFAQCGLEPISGCSGPQMLIVSGSDTPYAPPSPQP